MDSEVLLSVIIPVKNGDAWLRQTLPAIQQQVIPGKLEVIAIDSGSSDQSLQILSQYGVQVHSIPPGSFNHGLTRNLGVQLAKGRFVVMTVQDARPASDHWLNDLLEGFTDEQVAGVCGAQTVPHDTDKNPVDWYRPQSKPVMQRYYFAPGEFERLSPPEQLAFCRWDNVNAIYRKSILEKIPFREASFAEDALWARDALQAGYAIVYHPAARVEHYHHENFDFAYRRNFIVQYYFYKYFGVLPPASSLSVRRKLSWVKLLLKEQAIGWTDKLKWWKHNLAIYRAIDQSNQAFLHAQAGGTEAIEALYSKTITRIPQAIKAND